MIKEHKPVVIIAEAGVNHNGSLDLALKLVEEAKKTGADYVKFQTFKADSLVASYAQKAQYQLSTTSQSENQHDMIKKLELTEAMHAAIKEKCHDVGIGFLSSPFDLQSIEFLKAFGMDYLKIPSGEITNLPYLRAVNESGMAVILSTGMSTLTEVGQAIEQLKNVPSIVLLHCNTEYPTPMEDVNLRAMKTMADVFNVPVGYSDHTLGIEIPIAAVAMGAVMIEKHFTLDCNLPGPDHRASLEPQAFRDMVKAIRNIERALGNGVKQPSDSELPNRPIARKSIVAAGHIPIGHQIRPEDIRVKRPGTGLSPMKWDSVIGTIAKKDYEKDELIVL